MAPCGENRKFGLIIPSVRVCAAKKVRVWVNSSGRARRCEVARSSGFPALDKAALDAARCARYVSTRPGYLARRGRDYADFPVSVDGISPFMVHLFKIMIAWEVPASLIRSANF
ncbi:MAG: TonB family protein [Verrucomicrobiota bacterium]